MSALDLPTPRPRFAFVDPMCRTGYDPDSLNRGVLGGTEATVLRVTQALASDASCIHFQKGRTGTRRRSTAVFHPLGDAVNAEGIDAIIVINAWKVAVKLRRSHPHIPVFLWLHVYPGKHNRAMGPALKDASVTVICVSRSQAVWLHAFLDGNPMPPITHVWNPVDDGLRPDATPRDRNRLLFASSPHKGLREVYQRFAALRQTDPDLTLAVADPGYLRWETGPVPPGVIALGSLRHGDLIEQMRRSLCLFDPQTTFAETFGLVLAEANAVGTPVLAHRALGANDEVVTTPDQLVDCTDPAAIRSRIAAWQTTDPMPRLNPDFRMSAVRKRWLGLLTAALPCRARVPHLEARS